MVKQSTLGQLRWRCSRRSMLELDTLLTNFFDNHYLQLAPEEQQLFKRLLEYPDQMLYTWLLNIESPMDEKLLTFVKKIRQC